MAMDMHHRFHAQQHQEALRRPPAQRSRTERGSFDWLIPFIPPFLRVNRETKEALQSWLANIARPETLRSVREALVTGIQRHGVWIVLYGTLAALWVAGLYRVHREAHEFAGSYVILSGFAALGFHLIRGGDGTRDGMSAYSVFNKGGQRMMGSLSAEQFENEIRHRGGATHDAGSDNAEGNGLHQHEDDDDDENDE
ncbi:hypothetical protein PINS_up010079 [Pythium insidiosum]|nr:hypothetical protein PINS_up010079 [Pythium insidiosum]